MDRTQGPELSCFVCTEPLQRAQALAVRQRARRPAQAAVIRFHQTCAPRLAAAILQALDGRAESRAGSAQAQHSNVLRVRPDAGLTPREHDILERIVLGETNGQIARYLGISEKRVKNTVSVVLSKLEVQSRTEAAVFALRSGLIEQSAHNTKSNG